MHPDYADYVLQKRKIHPRAEWHDLKFLLRRLLALELDQIYCKRVDYNDWYGWLCEFTIDVDVGLVQREVASVVVLSDRVIFIGVNNG